VTRMHLSLKIFKMEMRFVSLGDYKPSGFHRRAHQFIILQVFQVMFAAFIVMLGLISKMAIQRCLHGQKALWVDCEQS
jgi:hemerythrin